MAITNTLSPITRPIYDRSYGPLIHFNWVWRALATYSTFMFWLASTPWLLIRQVAPYNFQDTLHDAEHGWLGFITPLVNFSQDIAYKVFAIADSFSDWFFSLASNILHNVEHRVRILKNDGLHGIPNALSLSMHTPLLAKTPLAYVPGADRLTT